MKTFLLILSLINLVKSYELIKSSAIGEKQMKLINLTVEIIKDWNSKHTSNFEKDIAVIDLDKNESFMDELLKKIPQENPKLVIRSKNDIETIRLLYAKTSKASLLLMISRQSDYVSKTKYLKFLKL